MKIFFKYLFYLSIISILAFLFYKRIYIPKHTFEIIKATKGDIEIKIDGIGNIGAKNIYKIASIYGGKIENFKIEEGEFLNKNSLIATIDSIDLVDKIDAEKALKEKILADINSLKIDKKSAEVNYKYQNELFKRNRRLYKLNSISNLDYQKYLTLKESAKLKIESIDTHILSLKAQLKEVVANINGLEKRLSYYKIEAPISGYVTKRLVTNYQIVIPNQTLIEIVNPKDVWVRAFIDTRISGEVKLGDRAVIKLRSSKKRYRGRVVNIKPINNPITYEREIDIAFENLPIPFYLEEQAKVKIDISKVKNIIKIPTKALSINNQQEGIWILRGKKVKFKPLNIIAYEDRFIAVKNRDILNEKIVVPDPKKKALKNGMKIYYD